LCFESIIWWTKKIVDEISNLSKYPDKCPINDVSFNFLAHIHPNEAKTELPQKIFMLGLSAIAWNAFTF
jgi:hypothetical protein